MKNNEKLLNHMLKSYGKAKKEVDELNELTVHLIYQTEKKIKR